MRWPPRSLLSPLCARIQALEATGTPPSLLLLARLPAGVGVETGEGPRAVPSIPSQTHCVAPVSPGRSTSVKAHCAPMGPRRVPTPPPPHARMRHASKVRGPKISKLPLEIQPSRGLRAAAWPPVVEPRPPPLLCRALAPPGEQGWD